MNIFVQAKLRETIDRLSEHAENLFTISPALSQDHPFRYLDV
jgi:hypothetical protein